MTRELATSKNGFICILPSYSATLSRLILATNSWCAELRLFSLQAMVLLIGIDCATQPNKVGLALGELEGDVVCIKACRTGSPKDRLASIVISWLQPGNPALMALDAPLGWPRAIGQALAGHQAAASEAHQRKCIHAAHCGSLKSGLPRVALAVNIDHPAWR
jgi:hypothetical protein